MADLGSDIAGVFDISWGLLTSSDRTALAEALLRRLTTPRGGLIGVPTYGYDVQTLIGATVPASVIEQRVLEQLLLDERVVDADVTVTLDERTGVLRVAMTVHDSAGPFDLTLTVSQLTVQAFLDSELFAEIDQAA